MTNDEIRFYVEQLMGWKEGESLSFSFITLRDFVRGKDPKFDLYFTNYIKRGLHLIGEGEK